MPPKNPPVEIELDVSMFKYAMDPASMVKFDPLNPARGSIYSLRAVGWPIGHSLHTIAGPAGHTFVSSKAPAQPQVLGMPALVKVDGADEPGLLGLAFRVYGEGQKLSVVCVPADLRIDANTWVSSQDFRYMKIHQIDKLRVIDIADGSHRVKNVNEYMKKHCDIFKGPGIPKSLRDARNWCAPHRWSSNLKGIMGAAELEVRRSVAAESGTKASGGSKAKGAAGAKAVESAELVEKLRLLRMANNHLDYCTAYFDRPLADRMVILGPPDLDALPLREPTTEERLNESGGNCISNAIKRAKREKGIWEGLRTGKAAEPPDLSPTLRSHIMKMVPATPSPPRINLPPPQTQAVPAPEVAAVQVVQIESVANEQQETPDAIDVEAESDQEFADRGESEEPDERPAIISALKERPHRERRPPEKSPEPHISPRKCGGRKSSPAGKTARGRKRERKTDKSETRAYTKSAKWYERYPDLKPDGFVDYDKPKPSRAAKGMCQYLHFSANGFLFALFSHVL